MRPALLLVAALALLTGAAPPPAGAQPAAAPVLVIGDSLEAGTAPLLRAELGAIPLTVDQRDGRASPAGVSALARRLRPEHGTVVFDLGTNDDPGDPGRLAASLSAVRELAGDRCLVVATVQRPPLRGIGPGALNREIRGFARLTPRTQLVDWHAAARSAPGLMRPDGVHPTEAGYALRASLVADAVAACLVPDPPKQPRRASRPVRGPAPRAAAPTPRLATPRVLALLSSAVRAAAKLVAVAGRDARQASGMDAPEPVLGG